MNSALEGAVRGVVGAMAMTALRQVTTGLGLVQSTPPKEIGEHGAPELLARLGPERRRVAIELLHWATGAGAGAAFGAAERPSRAPRWAGALYGIGVQAAYETTVAPLLGAPRSRPLAERIAIAADHVLFGLVLASGSRGR